jgi:hypothetical protein
VRCRQQPALALPSTADRRDSGERCSLNVSIRLWFDGKGYQILKGVTSSRVIGFLYFRFVLNDRQLVRSLSYFIGRMCGLYRMQAGS